MAQQQAIRDYLKSRGLKDEEITYDNGSVLARGKRFIDATPQADGRTYSDTRSLDNAYNDYDTRDQLAQLRTRSTQTNPELSSLQQAIKERINKPIQQFSYNAQSDPQYQAAIRQAQQNAQTAGNNAMVSLGSRGIGNSSITTDRVAQIQQRELGNVTDNVLPQLISQAYQRFAGDRQAENQQLNNMVAFTDYLDRSGQQQFRNAFDLLGTENTLNQQDRDNDYRSEVMSDKQKQDRINLANYLTTTYGIQVDPKMDSQLAYDQVKGLTPLDMQKYLQQKAIQEAGLTGQFNGQDTMDARKMAADIEDRKAQLAISRMNAGTSAANATNSAGNASARLKLDQDKFAYDKERDKLSAPKQQALTSYTSALNQRFLDKDNKVTNQDELELAIINLPVDNSTKASLYNYYGIPMQ